MSLDDARRVDNPTRAAGLWQLTVAVVVAALVAAAVVAAVYMTTGYLAEFAFDIDSDLKRALADCNGESTSLEYNYEGKAKGR
jgi:hypothetical protein